MITLETIINADLDAEIRQRNNIPQNNTNFRLKNVQVERERSVGSLTTLSEELEDNSPETDPNDTEHMKLFDQIIAFYSLFARVIGIDVTFQWDWKKNFLFCFAFLSAIITYVCVAYTEYVHYGDFVRMLEPLSITGIGTSGTLKLISFIVYWKSFVALIYNLRSICRRTAESSSRSIMLKTEFRKTYKLMKVFTVVILSVVSLYVIIPAKLLIVDKEVTTLMPMEIPFLDQSTLIGLVAAIAIQIIFGFLATIITVLYQLTFIIIICFYSIIVDLLAEDFRDLDKMWTGEIKVTVAYRHSFLFNICKKRQDMNCYMDWTKKLFETKLIYYFCVNYFCQIVSLYQITINDWISGYGPFIGLFVEMMFYCYMGTHISISDDRLCSAIYDTKWYEYDLISQRMILVLLHEAQMSRDLQLGFIGPLNMILFITVVKSIYSYYTVLTEML